MSKCYLCAAQEAKLPIESNLKVSFTDHVLARVPGSNKICQSCVYYLNLRCWYFNSVKDKWSKLFARNWSWLETIDYQLPKIEGEREGMPIVSELPTRRQILDLILNPPEPPFLIAIAKSGQKHIRPWAVEAQSRDYFPVTFEKDLIYLQRREFSLLERVFNGLRELGFSKIGIITGRYNSKKLMDKYLDPEYLRLEAQITPYRGSQQLELLGYLH